MTLTLGTFMDSDIQKFPGSEKLKFAASSRNSILISPPPPLRLMGTHACMLTITLVFCLPINVKIFIVLNLKSLLWFILFIFIYLLVTLSLDQVGNYVKALLRAEIKIVFRISNNVI